MMAPWGDGTILYLDYGGGFMNQYVWLNCLELNIHTHKWVHVKLVKSKFGGLYERPGCNTYVIKTLPLGETGWRVYEISVLFLYNGMWIYSFPKIKSFFKGVGINKFMKKYWLK